MLFLRIGSTFTLCSRDLEWFLKKTEIWNTTKKALDSQKNIKRTAVFLVLEF
jgi:hypothetical protein